ncbi:MAG: P1 family peptidase, partial [Nitratireductor sp.]|nr:P1 family peptidase [Nitratireductor sp.]
ATVKGGLGTASTILPNGMTIAALVAVNAVGTPLIGDSRHFWAAPFEMNDEFGGLGLPHPMPGNATGLRIKFRERSHPSANTTIAVIATDAVLTKAQAKRLAVAAHDGFARAIWPAHTPFDGDLVFALATGGSGIAPAMDDWIDLGAYAASTMSRAIARGVHDAAKADCDLLPVWANLA